MKFAISHYENLEVSQWDVINEMVNQGFENHTFFIDQIGDPGKILNFTQVKNYKSGVFWTFQQAFKAVGGGPN